MFCSVYSHEAFVRSQLPTCKHFYNVFHPSDLVAYRIEPLIKQYSYEGFEELSPESEPFSPDYNSNTHLKRFGSKADFTKSIFEMYEQEKDEEMPPPVLLPCYWNKGLNKAQ